MSDSNKAKLWLILGEEELPVGLVIAKTKSGAERKYGERSGESRYGIHAQVVEFDKGFCKLTPMV